MRLIGYNLVMNNLLKQFANFLTQFIIKMQRLLQKIKKQLEKIWNDWINHHEKPKS